MNDHFCFTSDKMMEYNIKLKIKFRYTQALGRVEVTRLESLTYILILLCETICIVDYNENHNNL